MRKEERGSGPSAAGFQRPASSCESPVSSRKLPVHGFVLAGGKSSRMGVDKATLEFCGRPLVEIAASKLRDFCADVSVVGNRDDLSGFAPVVKDERVDAGPGAGMEAGLGAMSQEWAVFVPVDVPLVPEGLLREWVGAELQADAEENGLLRGCGARLPWASYLVTGSGAQASFAVMHRDCRDVVAEALDAGERSLMGLFEALRRSGGTVRTQDAARFAAGAAALNVEVWFSNLNTPADVEEAESWANAAAEDSAEAQECGGPSFRSG